MKLDYEIIPVWEWLGIQIGPFLTALAGLALLSLFAGYVAGSLRHGPLEAINATIRTISTGLIELFQISPRRVYAMARLSFQESVRRKVFWVFIVFGVVLMFAAWYLDRRSEHPARLYISFVMTAANFLIVFLAVFVSSFSIPGDVKNRTIYTVVTKPVRAWEVVLGRMLGFCAIGTILIVVMCIASLIFVTRGLQHQHVVAQTELLEQTVEQDGESHTQQTGRSSSVHDHRHDVIVRDGKVLVEHSKDHYHDAVVDDGDVKLGRPRGMLQARVPIMGKLRFLDSSGQPGDGVNVGYESLYRQYIEGGTLATAIWRFKISEEDFRDDALPFEMTIRVFRTFQGEIESGLTGQIELVRPGPPDDEGHPTSGNIRSVAMNFIARDGEVYERKINRKITIIRDGASEEVGDVFRDLVRDGEIEVWVRCLHRAQYFGMAPADLYLRASNRPFWSNFIKGFASIWFQMVVVTCFGVMFSTFLNGSVAVLATLASMVLGYNKSMIFGVASGEIMGGGPLESFVRLILQWNQMVKLDDEAVGIKVLKAIDGVAMHVIEGVSYAMPNCSQFNTANFVAYGFNVPAELVAQHCVITAAYFIVLAAAGYFFFRTREIAA
ncbi:MAG: ABC transporter permease [Planctomycetales bacterium]|nr:ABC transporter permease [Planctomycetales bacterium]